MFETVAKAVLIVVSPYLVLRRIVLPVSFGNNS
jgi:hypothetical protein